MRKDSKINGKVKMNGSTHRASRFFLLSWSVDFHLQVLLECRLRDLNTYLGQMDLCSLTHLSSWCSFSDQDFIFLKIYFLFLYG